MTQTDEQSHGPIDIWAMIDAVKQFVINGLTKGELHDGQNVTLEELERMSDPQRTMIFHQINGWAIRLPGQPILHRLVWDTESGILRIGSLNTETPPATR